MTDPDLEDLLDEDLEDLADLINPTPTLAEVAGIEPTELIEEGDKVAQWAALVKTGEGLFKAGIRVPLGLYLTWTELEKLALQEAGDRWETHKALLSGRASTGGLEEVQASLDGGDALVSRLVRERVQDLAHRYLREVYR